MQNDIDAILISAGDDVVTLTREAPMGKTVRYLDGGDMAEIVSLGAPKFHKIAVRDIPAGCEIKKYGEVIGRAPDGRRHLRRRQLHKPERLRRILAQLAQDAGRAGGHGSQSQRLQRCSHRPRL